MVGTTFFGWDHTCLPPHCYTQHILFLAVSGLWVFLTFSILLLLGGTARRRGLDALAAAAACRYDMGLGCCCCWFNIACCHQLLLELAHRHTTLGALLLLCTQGVLMGTHSPLHLYSCLPHLHTHTFHTLPHTCPATPHTTRGNSMAWQ